MKRGFTLIELIVTIIILTIVLTIAIPSFQNWKRNEEVKRDIHYLYSIIQKTRSKAFLTKEDYEVLVNGTIVKVKNLTNSESLTFKLNTPFYARDNNGRIIPIKVYHRGTFNQLSIKCFNCGGLNLPYNCIKVTRYNLRITKCN